MSPNPYDHDDDGTPHPHLSGKFHEDEDDLPPPRLTVEQLRLAEVAMRQRKVFPGTPLVVTPESTLARLAAAEAVCEAADLALRILKGPEPCVVAAAQALEVEVGEWEAVRGE